MRCFFDKRATVVDVSERDVIDCFQGIFDHQTYIDFGHHRPHSISSLKSMVQEWADEEDKAINKYESTRAQKQQHVKNGGQGKNSNNRLNNNNYSGPNRKRRPDNTIAAMSRP